MKVIEIIVHALLMFYLIMPILSMVFVWLIEQSEKLRPKTEVTEPIAKQFDFAAIVAAHGQAQMLNPIVQSLVKQRYERLHIYLVADAIEADLSHLEHANVTVLKPNTPLNSKVASIQYAIANFKSKHEVISVFDADNLVHPDFFVTMNKKFNQGYTVVQGRIQAKNLNTSIARLDALNETYYSFVDRYSRSKMGLSAGMWGLGYAMKTELFTPISFGENLSGYDKKLQAELILTANHIGYANDAIVFDEKTSTEESLVRQRSKWLFGYFRHVGLGFKALMAGVATLSFDKINYSLNFMRPPLIVLLMLGLGILTADLIVSSPLAYAILVSLILFIIGFIGIILRYSYDRKVIHEMHRIPRFMILQCMALLSVKKGRFHKHTHHQQVLNIQDLL